MASSQIVFATGNMGKLVELQHLLQELPCPVVALGELGHTLEDEESADTYRENALIKAREGVRKTGLPCLAEDSGVELDAFPGELGVRTRRWGAGPDATDAEWLAVFMERIGLAESRQGRFVCAFALVLPTGEEVTVQAESVGIFVAEAQGIAPAGLPLSSYFVPDGQTTSYAMLGEEVKRQVGHRLKSGVMMMDVAKRLL